MKITYFNEINNKYNSKAELIKLYSPMRHINYQLKPNYGEVPRLKN